LNESDNVGLKRSPATVSLVYRNQLYVVQT